MGEIEFLTDEELRKTKRSHFETVAEKESFVPVSEKVNSINRFESWVKLDGLPSEYKPYPKGARFSYRKYVYGEMLKMNDPNLDLSQVYKIMLEGIRSTGETPVDPLMLTFEDFQFISTTRRLEYMGDDEFRVPYKCPHCGNTVFHNFRLSELEFKPMEASKVPATVRFMQYPGESFKFSTLTIGDLIWLLETETAYRRDENGSLTDAYDEVAFLARQCVNHSFEETYEAIRNLSNIEDIRLLNKLQELFSHGLKPLEFQCDAELEEEKPEGYETFTEEEKQKHERKMKFLGKPKCGKEVRVKVGADTLVVPFRRAESSSDAGIFFD